MCQLRYDFTVVSIVIFCSFLLSSAIMLTCFFFFFIVVYCVSTTERAYVLVVERLSLICFLLPFLLLLSWNGHTKYGKPYKKYRNTMWTTKKKNHKNTNMKYFLVIWNSVADYYSYDSFDSVRELLSVRFVWETEWTLGGWTLYIFCFKTERNDQTSYCWNCLMSPTREFFLGW